MKTGGIIGGIVLAFIAGALAMYFFMWFQVFHNAEKTWCQVYTGKFSVEQSERCKDLNR